MPNRAIPRTRHHQAARRAARGRLRAARALGAAIVALLPLTALVPASSGALASPASAARAGTAGNSQPARTRIGQVPVRRCAASPLTWCGHIEIPLDYSSAASPRIRISFRWLPATGVRRPAGTILAVEGGPGYASTGSESLYTAMAGPLLRIRNMLLVNLRGTGNSTPLNCPALENAGPRQSGPRFNRLVTACGSLLNHTWRYRGGGWVHASDLFNTANSARDTSVLLRELRAGRVDLYGDSYGSWFAQVFASRYAAQLRSVTLDSTYQVLGLDPWYVTTVITARRAFDLACSRSAACAAAGGRSTAWARIGALARRLARHPVSGFTTSASGTRTRFRVDTETLVNLVNNAGFDPVVYADLDAAGRALLRRGDAAPLLRIAALSLGFDDSSAPLPEFSDGLFFAVGCTDYVQLFSRTARPAVRGRQYQAALRREPAGTFAPFTVAQWTGLDQYTEAYSACLHWPSPVHRNPPITARPPLVPPRLHVLILSGTFDSLTPRLRGATVVARQMGPSARLVTFANLTHVMEEDGDNGCAESVIRRFVASPGGLAGENVSCAGRVAPVHSAGSYPRRLSQAQPAAPAAGNQAGRLALQAAAVALAAAGDEISRWNLLSGSADLGLRGGRVSFGGGTTLRICLRAVRWVTDAVISGTARWNQSTGQVTARLTVRTAHGGVVRVTARWLVYGQPGQHAMITGTAGSARLAATAPAP